VTKNVAVWPMSTDWLMGGLIIAGVTAAPVPVIWIVSGELNCALAMEALPEAFPPLMGAKLAVNVKLFPGDKAIGSDPPPMPKPAPVAVAWEMVTGTLPEFVKVKL
jgi:hypothetical protein